jgi:predicted nucleic acid-binding protein
VTLRTIVDTGPLVAFFNEADTYHEWASAQFARLVPPLLTCEAVLGEVGFLLARAGIDRTAALHALARGALRLDFSLGGEIDSVQRLMTRYKDADVSLADACLVRMSEIHPRCEVMTIDRDFLVYRRDGRRTIPLIAPFR